MTTRLGSRVFTLVALCAVLASLPAASRAESPATPAPSSSASSSAVNPLCRAVMPAIVLARLAYFELEDNPYASHAVEGLVEACVKVHDAWMRPEARGTNARWLGQEICRAALDGIVACDNRGTCGSTDARRAAVDALRALDGSQGEHADVIHVAEGVLSRDAACMAEPGCQRRAARESLCVAVAERNLLRRDLKPGKARDESLDYASKRIADRRDAARLAGADDRDATCPTARLRPITIKDFSVKFLLARCE